MTMQVDADTDTLHQRVDQFNAMELPGQIQAMHMGTFYLVNDLWKEVRRLRKALDAANDPTQGLKLT